MANHLAGELSPYLRQHAHNPVEWYPWGEVALEKARQEDKPIFLSIGYASCHWCHVMAHESFEDGRIAAILNAHFVSIKVDREERPDLDRVYMAAVQAITGRGGWPMSVFLLPDGSPFYGGTYYPPTPRYGMPSFEQVLLSITEAWRERRDELLGGAQQLLGLIRKSASPDMSASDGGQLDEALPARMVASLASAFDEEHKGWGEGNKFPQPMLIAFLLRHHRRTGDALALRLAAEALEAMARGGLYDQIGGGFHRYTVDEAWRVPHFEKMLYDNAQLARVYTHAWQLTGQPLYRAVAEETLDYVLREMRDPAGGFYAAQDADSEGVEGKYFVWSLSELEQALGEEAPAFARAYGATEDGSFEGRNVLAWQGTWTERAALGPARRRLLDERQRRVAPGRDDKVLVSWNGLMLAALADAGAALSRPDYLEAARNNAALLLSTLRTAEGRLRHSWIAGVAAGEGFLDDYTHLMEGLLALYQATLEERWALAAAELLEQVLADFGAEQGFCDTGAQHEQLVVRPRELSDNAVPSGNGMIVGALLRLAVLLERPALAELARTLLGAMQSMLARYPQAFGQWLCALEAAQAPLTQVVVCGERGDPAAERLLTEASAGYQPDRLLGWVDPRQGMPGLFFLRGHALVDGQPAAYVCQGSACHAPVTSQRALRELLAKGA